MIVMETVVHHLAIASGTDDLKVSEESQLMGNRGLAHAHRLCEIGGTELAQAECVDDPDSGWIAQQPKGFCESDGDVERDQTTTYLGLAPVGRGSVDSKPRAPLASLTRSSRCRGGRHND